MATTTTTRPRMRQRYDETLRAQLQESLELPNVMMVPKLAKISVNMGVGDAVSQASLLDGAQADLAVITGQKPLVTRAKKSIAGFKLREGNAIGAKVTLRGDRMYEFFDRLVSVAIPRIRDFRGLNPRSFDGNGNYTFGVSEHHGRHHRPDRRRGQGTARCLRLPLPKGSLSQWPRKR
jgi:large subunit ribosomal protein L5